MPAAAAEPEPEYEQVSTDEMTDVRIAANCKDRNWSEPPVLMPAHQRRSLC